MSFARGIPFPCFHRMSRPFEAEQPGIVGRVVAPVGRSRFVPIGRSRFASFLAGTWTFGLRTIVGLVGRTTTIVAVAGIVVVVAGRTIARLDRTSLLAGSQFALRPLGIRPYRRP